MKTLLVFAAGLVLAGCTLFDDPPDRSCKKDPDCFRAQGERCNQTTNTCEVPPDAGTTFAEDESSEETP